MKETLNQPAIDVIEEVVQIWRTYDPVEGYAAGFDAWDGRLFVPDEAATENLTGRISAAEARLEQIADEDYQIAARKLLAAIRLSLQLELPQSQVLNCGVALLYVELKDRESADFVDRLLKNIVQALKFECAKWRNKTFSGQTSKAVVDAIAFLNEMLSKMIEKYPEVGLSVKTARSELREFRAIFPSPLSNELDELFSFFEQYPTDSVSPVAYAEMLKDVFDYGVLEDQIRDQSERLLSSELDLIRKLIPKLVEHLKIELPKDQLGDIYDKLIKTYQIAALGEQGRELNVLGEAHKIMMAVNKYVECYVQDIPDRPVALRPTPPMLQDLVTSGATVVLDYLQPKPNVFIFITEEKNSSWLTLLNLLVHEATHAYQPIILAEQSHLPTFSKLRSLLGIPFMEASAFHRELEAFEALKAAVDKGSLRNKVEDEFLSTFDASKFSNRIDVDCFELETRVWRVMRALRSLCDVEVNSGRKTYVEFIDWAVEKSGLKKQFIHNECFTFLSSPGYTPSYSFCGGQYADLQERAKGLGINRLDFNTQANAMGLWPWRLCVQKMENFKKTLPPNISTRRESKYGSL